MAKKSGKTVRKSSSKPPKQLSTTPQDKHADKYRTGQAPAIVLPGRMTTYTIPPTGWPSSMPYLSTALLAASTLTLEQQALVHPPINNQQPMPGLHTIATLVVYSPTVNPLIQIKAITDANHPAYPQSGLFAAKALPPGTHIVDYTGQIHSCPQPTCGTSDYDLAFLDRDASLAIDSAAMGNEARFVNDYHGIREQGPNAMFEEYHVKVKNAKLGKDVWQARMGIWVMPSKLNHGIAKGEEICVSYGKGWWRARRSLMEGHDDIDGYAIDHHSD